MTSHGSRASLRDGMDVSRLVELAHARLAGRFVCAARPENFFLPSCIVGLSLDAPHDVAAELAGLVLQRAQAVVVADVSSQLAVHGTDVVGLASSGVSGNTLTSQPSGAAGTAAVLLRAPGSRRAASDARATQDDEEMRTRQFYLVFRVERSGREIDRRERRRARRSLGPEHAARAPRSSATARPRRCACRSGSPARGCTSRRADRSSSCSVRSCERRSRSSCAGVSVRRAIRAHAAIGCGVAPRACRRQHRSYRSVTTWMPAPSASCAMLRAVRDRRERRRARRRRRGGSRCDATRDRAAIASWIARAEPSASASTTSAPRDTRAGSCGPR